MATQLVAVRDKDYGPGPPYQPVIRTVGLFQVSNKLHGKQFYMRFLSDSCGQTWLSDDDAKRFLSTATEVMFDPFA